MTKIEEILNKIWIATQGDVEKVRLEVTVDEQVINDLYTLIRDEVIGDDVELLKGDEMREKELINLGLKLLNETKAEQRKRLDELFGKTYKSDTPNEKERDATRNNEKLRGWQGDSGVSGWGDEK